LDSAAVTYTGSRYEVSFYGTAWSNISYKFMYSTSDMTSIGFSHGIDGGAAIPSTQTSEGGNVWFSGATSALGNVYFGIRPTFSIGGCSGAGQSPIWCVLDYNLDMNYATGDHVTVSGVGGNTAANQTNAALAGYRPRQYWTRFNPQVYTGYVATAFTNNRGLIQITTTPSNNFKTGDQIQCFSCGGNANGLWTITKIDSSNFTLNGSTYTGGYTVYSGSGCDGGNPCTVRSVAAQINDITSLSGTCTVHMNVQHNLVPGWRVEISNTTSANIASTGDILMYYTVLSTPTSSSFTFSCPGETNTTPHVYNTDLDYLHRMTIISFPAFAVPGTGNGTYQSGGTVVATDETKNFMQLHFDPPSTP
jgi:hypothetical protein